MMTKVISVLKYWDGNVEQGAWSMAMFSVHGQRPANVEPDVMTNECTYNKSNGASISYTFYNPLS